MRIAIIHWNFSLYWLARIRVLAELLCRHGASLFVVQITDHSSKTSADQSHNSLGDAKWTTLFSSGKLAKPDRWAISRLIWKTLDQINPDVVLSSAIAFPSGANAVAWCRSRKRICVVMDDARLQDVPRSCLVNYMKRMFYRNVDAVLLPAPSHDASYRFWGVRPERMYYGVDVIDNAWFAERSASINQDRSARAKANLPERFFLGIGRQIREKNWSTLIRAYAQYEAKAGKDAWSLVLVGEGPERVRLQGLAKELGVRSVFFLPFCAQEKACMYYALASALILPSYMETWGLVVNEAMACGLPVLVSNQCGCAESLVAAGENGWTFSPDNETELADLLLRMADMDDNRRKLMGDSSRRIIAQWPIERFAEGAWAAIESCTGVRRGFAWITDRVLLPLWKGRFRPT